ncbi:MAG TPA: glycosyltransferase family 4 protein [Thermoleophilaceae bacterium]|jgi:glycosyltransferase involved in cell wall biosynthesis|nr:glycosyltransferase family 4 protein [Thermoleophilaceae bacterium]
MRVLVVHNRYRVQGGEERAVELQVAALRRAGVPHALLERDSAEVSRGAAARALWRGGRDETDVGAAVRELEADVVHVHNMLPLFGPRALAAGRKAGARVVLELHNVRLFCAIGVAARDGGPCFRCHHRRTLPGLMLNCRGSLPEAAVYAASLARHQPAVIEAVDRFLVPSRSAAGQVASLGLPADRVEVLPHFLPEEAFAQHSVADEGRYALVAARLSVEKGIDTAIEAASTSGVPLRVAGEGPAAAELHQQATRLGAPVEFLGRLDRAELQRELAGAAMLLMPSRYHEFAGYAALEAMAAGVPVVVSTLGAPPELAGHEHSVAPNDPRDLAERMTALWGDPDRRGREGDALLARASDRYGESRYVRALLSLYERLAEPIEHSSRWRFTGG